MDISIIILTLNEELHIRRCIENVAPLACDVFVVDCFSTDKTVEIAKECGASVVQNLWPGVQSLQFNWALEHLPIRTKWVLRLDADEYLYPELIDEIRAKLDELPDEVTGVAFKRRHIFLGRWIKRGTYPVTLVRLFRYGKARSEQRLMDEHIELLEGRSVTFDGDFADDNLNDIGWWTAKHNGYALREAVDLLDLEYGILEGSNAPSALVQEGSNAAEAAGSRVQGFKRAFGAGSSAAEAAGSRVQGFKRAFGAGSSAAGAAGSNAADAAGSRVQGFKRAFGAGSSAADAAGSRVQARGALEGQAAEKRRKKMKYARLPLFWRAFAYFCYRYFLRGGFLEGREGFLWHFLQGWWYRTLVDAKVWEIKRASGGDPQKMLALLRDKYGMKI